MRDYRDQSAEANYWRGYRRCYLDLCEHNLISGVAVNKHEDKVYIRALCNFFRESWQNVKDYISLHGSGTYEFTNHKRNKNGRLMSVEVKKKTLLT